LRIEPVQAGVPHRLTGCAQRKQDVPLELPDLLRGGDLRGVEVLDLRGDAHGRLARVERADPVDAALARQGRPPGRRRIVAERRDRAESGDGDSSHRVSLDRAAWPEVTR